MKSSTTNVKALIPILFSFFVMGFADMVGISVNYMKSDFTLSDKVANLLPMMLFLWFAVLSLPVGRFMDSFGRKKTVLLSAVITAVALILPMLYYSFPMALIAFAMLGIGNTILQVSLNPLLTDVVPSGKVSGMLALGQFVKAICSTVTPILVGIVAVAFDNWKIIFPIYSAITVISWVWLVFTEVDEKRVSETHGAVKELFKDGYLMMLFSVIILIVGFEVGLTTAIPKYLTERFSMTLDQGAFVISLYYGARTAGTFAGSVLLNKFPVRKFMIVTMVFGVAFLAGFIALKEFWMICTALVIVGLCCANVFAAVLGEGMRYKPAQANEISALMVTGVAGGAVIPPVMGLVADYSSQTVSLFVPLAALVYILFVSYKIKK